MIGKCERCGEENTDTASGVCAYCWEGAAETINLLLLRVEAERDALKAELQAAKAEVERLRDFIKTTECPHCGGLGWVITKTKISDPEQERCDWCATKSLLTGDDNADTKA